MPKWFTALLLLISLCFIGSGFYMQAKAQLAQWLIAYSWQQSQQTNSPPPKPWWWADTKAVAKLSVPALSNNLFVMQDASGESLAFGPGHVAPSQAPAQSGHVVIAAHRDSHFSFLQHMKVGMQIDTQHFNGQKKHYKVTSLRIINSDQESIILDETQDRLTLVTCYPFDSIIPGGPLRLLVEAVAIAS